MFCIKRVVSSYTAVSSTNLRTQTAEYYALEQDDGLTMNLAVNPLLQFGLEETREELCRNILADISVVNYVPFDSSTIGNPALDLGDVLTFTGGQADGAQIACITSSNCKIGGKHTLKCVGKNSRLAQAKSKNDKNISGLLNQIEAGKIGIHTFTNASAFTVAETDVKIITIEFATSEDNHAQFFGSVIVDVEADAVERTALAKGEVVIPAAGGTETGTDEVQSPGEAGQALEVELPVIWSEDGQASAHFMFEFNDSVVAIHQPEETWHSGRHTILLYYPIEGVVANYTNVFNVYMRMGGGTGMVDTGSCIASISGQSMGAQSAWDGEIKVEEWVGRAAIGGGIRAVPTGGEIGMEIDETMKRDCSDAVPGRAAVGAFARPVEMEV